MAQIRDAYFGDHPDYQARVAATIGPRTVMADRLEDTGHPHAEGIRKVLGYKKAAKPVEYDGSDSLGAGDDEPDAPDGFVLSPENN